MLLRHEASYSGEGENIGTCKGVVELLELVVILLFRVSDTPVKVICTGLATPACLNTSPLPLVQALYYDGTV